MGKRAAIVIVTAAFAALGAQRAAAATIEVTNTDDSGAGSLRAAINRANQLDGSDRIEIEATGTIPLQSPLPTVTSTPLVIQGPGPSNLGLDGSAVSGATLAVEPVNKCIPSRVCQVFLRGLSIDHAPTAIRNRGVLNVINVSLSDNGAGIYNERRLQVIDSSLSDNRYGISDLNIANRAIVVRSTLRGNRTGISNGDIPLSIIQSAVIGNHRYGIDNAGEVAILLSSFAGSRITSAGGTVDIRQSTLRANGDHAVISGSDNNPTSLQSTIVANPSSGAACSGPVTSVGFNLADDGSCNLSAQDDQPNTDPLLRPLGIYGGPTKTFALPKTSPALDAGHAFGTTTDQRGRPRMVDYPGVPPAAGGDNSDIGAFELQAP